MTKCSLYYQSFFHIPHNCIEQLMGSLDVGILKSASQYSVSRCSGAVCKTLFTNIMNLKTPFCKECFFTLITHLKFYTALNLFMFFNRSLIHEYFSTIITIILFVKNLKTFLTKLVNPAVLDYHNAKEKIWWQKLLKMSSWQTWPSLAMITENSLDSTALPIDSRSPSPTAQEQI